MLNIIQLIYIIVYVCVHMRVTYSMYAFIASSNLNFHNHILFFQYLIFVIDK